MDIMDMDMIPSIASEILVASLDTRSRKQYDARPRPSAAAGTIFLMVTTRLLPGPL